MSKAGVVGCEDFGEWINKGNRSKFCDHFLRAVVGHRRFDCDKKESILSNWITVSDEAFAMLVGENNIDRWIDMYRRDDKKKSDVIPRYTNGGKSQVRNGSSQRCKGWTVEGTKRYGQLYRLVEKERATIARQEFEEHYLKKKKEEFENERALRKKRPMDRDEADEILIPHSLWSEDEAEYASGTGTEEASEEEDEDELRRKNLYDEPDDDANDDSVGGDQD